jgi:hypothetical protein
MDSLLTRFRHRLAPPLCGYPGCRRIDRLTAALQPIQGRVQQPIPIESIVLRLSRAHSSESARNWQPVEMTITSTMLGATVQLRPVERRRLEQHTALRSRGPGCADDAAAVLGDHLEAAGMIPRDSLW